jgi:heme O synthase-like polyprenyltransferase
MFDYDKYVKEALELQSTKDLKKYVNMTPTVYTVMSVASRLLGLLLMVVFSLMLLKLGSLLWVFIVCWVVIDAVFMYRAFKKVMS